MKRTIFVIGFLFILSGCIQSADSKNTHLPMEVVNLVSPTGESLFVTVEVATTPEQREVGLMYRRSIAEDKGMLFIFQQFEPQTFWMKNTLIPLDILFFDTDGRLVSSTTMVPCTADPCPTYPSNGPVISALELSPGFVHDKGIGAGWRLMIH